MSGNMTVGTGRGPDGRFSWGNRFWEARSTHGRNPKYESAEALEDAISQYFQWNDDNPLYKDQLVTFQGSASHEPVAQMRAMTIAAMCMFIGVDRVTWLEWKRSRPDFSKVQSWAEDVIFRQKFEGASADLLNAGIIARDLGMTDRKEVDHTSSDGSMTPRDASAAVLDALNRKHDDAG